MKRGGTNLSFVVGIDKPVGLTSHDVVNGCRRIFGEKRIGHTGTLDPMASGAMAVCVGPATKLSNYLTRHDKAYLARIVFGAATDTDDVEGQIIREAPVPNELSDEVYAQAVLNKLLGEQSQLPPAYSAVKVGGVKSYEAARKGKVIDLSPRTIEVFRADLAYVGRDGQGVLFWDVRFEVSAGTYIRSLARDLGISQGTCAHLGALRRLRSGRLQVGECVSLEALGEDPQLGRIDPIRMLDIRFAAVGDDDGGMLLKRIQNGAQIRVDDLTILEYADDFSGSGSNDPFTSCTSGVVRVSCPLAEAEVVGILHENKLIALYKHDVGGILRSCCGFTQGVSRGIV